MTDEDLARLVSWGLHLNTPEPALICIACRYSLQPLGEAVNKHLWEKHSIPTGARRGLSALVRSLRLSDPNTITSRADGSAPHPYLIAQQGATCRHCLFRSTSVELVGRHLSKTHGLRGYKGSTIGDHLDDSIWLQSWTQNGSRAYWTVQTPAASNEATRDDVGGTPRHRQWLDALHRGERDRIAQEARTRLPSDTGGDDLSLTSNWMRRTDWASTFRGANRPILRRLALAPSADGRALAIGEASGQPVLSPSGDEQRLLVLGLALDAFFDRCEDTVLHTSHSIRCWLRGYFPDKPFKAPFQLPGRLTTRRRYRGLWKQMTYFAIRLWRLDPAVRREFVGSDMSPQWNGPLADLWQHSWWIGPGMSALSGSRPQRARMPEHGNSNSIGSESGEDSGSSGDDSTDGSDGDAEESDRTTTSSGDKHDRVRQSTLQNRAVLPALEQLGDLIGLLAAAFCKEEFYDGRAASTLLVYFSGVLGFSPDGHTFQRPTNYTSKLSALIYCIRLVLLEATLPRRAHPYIGWLARTASKQLATLQSARRRFLCWGCQAPMGELLSLLSYGRSISRSDGPTFRVRWSDDGECVSWADGRLSMNQFRQLGRKVLEDASSGCTHLMYGLRSRVRIESVQDDMANTSAGYSFLGDARNRLETAYLDLSERACLNPLDGLMSHGLWNIPLVNEYLDRERGLVRQLMLLMYMFGGQAPRSTELFSIETENGPGTSRGIYVHGGSIVYVTRHTKARRATNREFQIARYLPREVSELLLSYLVYVRRFAEMLRRNCLGYVASSRLLFYTPGLEQTPWSSAALSKGLTIYTTKVLGLTFGVQAYRQLSIAITERHVRQISKSFDRYCDKGRDKDLEVAFAWQSGHRPLLRGTIYGLDAAYRDSLQPSLLRIYEWASCEWHHFLQTEAYTDSFDTDSVLEKAFRSEAQVLSSEGGDAAPKRKTLHESVLCAPSPKRACLSSYEVRTIDRQRTELDSATAKESTGALSHSTPMAIGQFDNSVTNTVRVSECRRVAYATNYKVVICIPCGHCIMPPPHTVRHFRDMHSNWPIKARKALAKFINELCLVEPESLTYSGQSVPPVPYLPILDGWNCLRCEYSCVSEGTMQTHSNTTHRWLKGHGKIWKAARVQTFFSGSNRRFFTVQG